MTVLPIVTAIKLGSEENIPDILPAAFYEANRFYTHRDPHYARAQMEGSDSANFAAYLPLSLSALDTSSVLRLMQGREWLSAVFARLIREDLPDSVEHRHVCLPDKPEGAVCIQAISDWWKSEVLPETAVTSSCFRDPLLALKELQVSVHKAVEPIRWACRFTIEELFTAARAYIWRDLSAYFNLTDPPGTPPFPSWVLFL